MVAASVSAHLQTPNQVLAQVGRLICRQQQQVLPYIAWSFIKERQQDVAAQFLPIGFAGVLYPPSALSEQVFDEALYQRLCPKADDLWFKAMSSIHGISARCVGLKAKPIPIMRSQQVALNASNIDQDRNRQQWLALCEHFPELKELG